MACSGDVVLVTGSGTGLGRGIAMRFARSGARVAVADIDETAARTVAKSINDSKGTAIAVAMDVSDSESVSKGVSAVISEFGQVDVLVNNAGVEQRIVPLVELGEEEWRRILDVNLTGIFLCCRAVAPGMMKREHGKIINISSINGLSPAPFCVAYNVSKAGIPSLTRTLAYELAPYKINVNAVCPGPVHTRFTESVMTQRSAMAGITQGEIEERIRAAVPLGRWGTPDDIAGTVLFLASEDAAWTTGETLTVSGGLIGVSGSVGKKK